MESLCALAAYFEVYERPAGHACGFSRWRTGYIENVPPTGGQRRSEKGRNRMLLIAALALFVVGVIVLKRAIKDPLTDENLFIMALFAVVVAIFGLTVFLLI